jgi:hypothetical protein
MVPGIIPNQGSKLQAVIIESLGYELEKLRGLASSFNIGLL